MSNYSVYIEGTEDQYILHPGTFTGNNFTLVSMIGNALWLFNGYYEPPYSGAQINISPYTQGIWQPYLGDVYGRLITIGSGASTLAAPVNISTFVANGEIKLRWDQVSGAVFYNVYRSDDPNGPFSEPPLRVFDPDPADGFVQIEVSAESRKFFKVTAGN
jgi:hypothetical protein